MQRVLRSTPGLRVIEDAVEGLETADGRVTGVRGALARYEAGAVVVTTGTFLRALMHCGEFKTPGGRIGEGSAEALSAELARLGLQMGRLKTGTPPRLRRSSLDFSRLTEQPGDPDPEPFSFYTRHIPLPQIRCWLTQSTPAAHAVVRANLDRAPMYSGQIRSRGPRYCPSFEDKVVRFADKSSHPIFLEPEGLDSESIYCNGISTSTPPDVQEAFVRAIPGLERAEFLRYGYAVEYDFVLPHQLDPTLETKAVRGLFLAGQINGTSGYEEAAGQGLLAGINAALRVRGGGPLVLSRSQAYIGVMADDLTTKSELAEPYRMFTSLAEHRLILRSDNAFRRLMPLGRRLGLVSEGAIRELDAVERGIGELKDLLGRRFYGGQTLERRLRRPGESLGRLAEVAPEVRRYLGDRRAVQQVEIEVKYAGYIQRQRAEIDRASRLEERSIPADLDYRRVRHLRFEAQEKLARQRPYTLGQASRITGISPADVQVLLVHLGWR
jgi:tRNA uridine 5-carboxymethylaminomethyl modification enzyme